jgi:hypothetical protein
MCLRKKNTGLKRKNGWQKNYSAYNIVISFLRIIIVMSFSEKNKWHCLLENEVLLICPGINSHPIAAV